MYPILPVYDQIPNVGLYLEQVTKFLNEYLEPLGCPPITGSMISNYVKKDLVENPVKKQYDRERIARLMLIAVGKTVLSLEEIQQLLRSCPGGQEGYDTFCSALTRELEQNAVKSARDLLQETMAAAALKLSLERRFREELSGVC